ncbi:unnamed protein product, partial [Polarella glacialis]
VAVLRYVTLDDLLRLVPVHRDWRNVADAVDVWEATGIGLTSRGDTDIMSISATMLRTVGLQWARTDERGN